MKNINLKKFFLSILFIFGLFFVKSPVFAEKIAEFTIHKGQSMFISNEQLRNEEVLSSENEEVVSVSNGVITALSEGEAFCKSVKKDSDGTDFEKKYKIKVLPPALVKYGYCQPNNPKVGEKLTIYAMTDKSVADVKFVVSTKNRTIKLPFEEKNCDGSNFIYKASFMLKSLDEFKVNYQVKVDNKWHIMGKFLEVKPYDESANTVSHWRASDKCVDYVLAKEGFKPALSVDRRVSSVYDIGCGNVVKPGEGFYNNISPVEAKAMLLEKLNNDIYSQAVNGFIMEHNLVVSQNEFDALLSLTYNCGRKWMSEPGLRDAILSKKILIKSIGTVNSDNGLKLRAQTDLQGEFLRVLKFNEQVEILGDNNDGWYKVKTQDGQEGYCFAEFLKVKNNYTDSNIAVVNSSNGLKVRTAPDTDSDILTTLKFNEQVEILNGSYYDWYKVKTKDGQEGYCFAEFLTVKPYVVRFFIDKKEFSKSFLAYHNAGGKFVRGLLYRRIEELQMFLYNDYSRDGALNKYNFLLPDRN